jgi:hypothetical protein
MAFGFDTAATAAAKGRLAVTKAVTARRMFADEIAEAAAAAGPMLHVAEDARSLTDQAPNFALAVSAHDRGLSVVPLDPEGEPLADAGTRDLQALTEMWRETPDAVAGVDLAASGLIAVEVESSDGAAWLARAGIETPPVRNVRNPYLMGVPGDDDPVSLFEDEAMIYGSDVPAEPYARDHGGASLRLIEVATTGLFLGTGHRRLARALIVSASAERAQSNPVLRDRSFLLWSAAGLWGSYAYDPGRVARGLRVVPFLPADSAVIVGARGVQYRAMWPYQPGNLPEWVAEVVGATLKPPAEAIPMGVSGPWEAA